MNDPLQTLYQMMSGRQPIAVKECADSTWGDWRPHLAMILSNSKSAKDGMLLLQELGGDQFLKTLYKVLSIVRILYSINS